MISSLFGLALRNLQVKHLRFYIILFGVSIVIAAFFASSLLVSGIHQSLEKGLSKLGADLLVIPEEALVNMKNALLTGEPSSHYMDAEVIDDIGEIKGVKRVAGQVFLTSATGECCVSGNSFLIGFNPADDFTVLPWVDKAADEELPQDGVIVGAMTQWEIGEEIKFYGVDLTVWAKLERTGIGLYDNAAFFNIKKAYEMAEMSQNNPETIQPLKPIRGKISGGLVQLELGSKAPFITFSILRDNPGLKVVTTGNIQTSARQTTVAVFFGIIALIILLVISNILMINAIFSAVVNERRREIGIIRAIGATRADIFKLILYESSLISFLSGIIGIFIGFMLLRVFQRSIIFYLKLLNIPFVMPSYDVVAAMAFIAIAVAFIMGISGSAYPAALAVKIDPHDTMKQGL